MTHDAEPGDLFVDAGGKLWRVIWTCGEPTVGMREVEPAEAWKDSPITMSGAVSGGMWQGFKRIYRPGEEATK